MDEQEGSVKRRNRLAVFEHFVEKEKKSKKRKLHNRLNSEDSSASESELVINDEKHTAKKKKSPLMKLTEEPLNLQCEWNDCNEVYNTWEKFNSHVIEHATNNSDDMICYWKNCSSKDLQDVPLLMQHMSYHAYISKLQNIGQNICQRNKLPDCTVAHSCQIPSNPTGYKCEWEYCSFDFCTIYDFLNHMNVHIRNNPRVASSKEVIVCCWEGCNTKYSTQTKLAEHLRTHTKEKSIGCPSCGRLFSNKTKYCDHRKRQLSHKLQSYQCSQCLKLFPSERLLRDHMRCHVNHYKCNMCDMTCTKPSILAKHIRYKHVNFKPYKCPECDKTFVEKYNLRTHLMTHEEKNPYKCDDCDFECRSSVGLENHYVKKHEAVSSVYECHCCKKKFKRGTYLTKHLTNLHNYHWPSGHSRFRYRKDQDGIYRLQTVRYESLEVTQEMIRSESMQTSTIKQPSNYTLRYENNGYVLSVSEDTEERAQQNEKEKEQNDVLITINDLDEDGNVLKCEVMESKLIQSNDLPRLEKAVPIVEHVCKQEINEVPDTESRSITTDYTKLISVKEEKDSLSMTILDYEMFKNN